MRILVTGAKGFIGRNLVAELKNRKDNDIFEYDADTDPALLNEYCKQAEFVYHLAGVNRPVDQSEYMVGNYGFTKALLDTLKQNDPCPVMFSSSIQAEISNDYGNSKKAGEDLVFQYAAETSTRAYIYRLPNIFGKWCRPNYNSVVATFCHNIAHGLPVTVHDPKVRMKLAYIDDVIQELINASIGKEQHNGEFCEIPVTYTISLGEMVDIIYSFQKSRTDLSVPDMSDPFVKKLYSTYTSYLPEESFCYELQAKSDQRGSFTEVFRTSDRGQISVNITKPGFTKGNHWHHTKTEKFLVLGGEGVIRLRKINTNKVIEFYVSSKKLEVVDIPVGYTHSIENIGREDLITLMWVNESFNSDYPDTYYLEV